MRQVEIQTAEDSLYIKWDWMYKWCEERGLAPSQLHVWEQAEQAWKDRKTV